MSVEPADRPPLIAPTRPGWRVEVVPESGSTNADVAARARAGEPAGLALVAEHQTAGRGRLGREWQVAPRAALTVSMLLRPDVAPERWSWLPLLTGIAVVRAIGEVTGLRARLKWPNDVLLEGPGVAGEGKVGGILLERIDHAGGVAAVLGIGLNVHQGAAELPVETATSLALAGAVPERGELLGALLAEVEDLTERWRAGEDLRPEYLALCSTVGRPVRVTVPGAAGEGRLEGRVVDVDGSGRLVLEGARGEQHLDAGDVVHVRPQV